MTTWERPAEYPYPYVWRRFEIYSKNDNKVHKFRIQDATIDMLPIISKHIIEQFITEEPLARSQDTRNDEDTISEFKMFWEDEIKGGVFLVCFEEYDEPGKPEKLVGSNVTGIRWKGRPVKLDWRGRSACVFNTIFSNLSHEAKVFSEFGVDKYLTAYGFSVHRDYRGMGIGVNILEARTEMCKAMDIPLTVALFTSPAGQAAAARAGFQVLDEVKYKTIQDQCDGVDLHEIAVGDNCAKLMYKKC